MNQRGGVFGGEQTAEIRDKVARLIDKAGKVVIERPLEATTTTGVSALAAKVLSTIADSTADDSIALNPEATRAVDSMATHVNIDDGARKAEYSFQSGDEVPPEVSELVRAVLEAPYRLPRNLSKS